MVVLHFRMLKYYVFYFFRICLASSGQNSYDILSESDRGLSLTETSLQIYHLENFEDAKQILFFFSFMISLIRLLYDTAWSAILEVLLRCHKGVPGLPAEFCLRQ